MKRIDLLKNIIIITILSSITGGVAVAKLSGSLSIEATEERITPLGEVNIAQDKTEADANEESDKAKKDTTPRPIKIYKANCAMCHAVALAGAPKPGDKAAWDKRLKQGKDTLLAHVVNGYKAMPPKGGCMKCSTEDLSDTIEQMITGEGLQ